MTPERWLAVQGDPASQAATSLEDAKTRLDTFRDNGGFWYYSSTPHWKLPEWFVDADDSCIVARARLIRGCATRGC